MFGWLRVFARSRVERAFLLDHNEFDALLARERSRANRAGGYVSVLHMSVPATHVQPTDLHAITEILRHRRRATDLAGRTQDGRIAIALPDTGRDQAEVLAASLNKALGARGIFSTHTICVYPETNP